MAGGAARAGATAIAPALAEDEEYLRGLGVSELLTRDGDVAADVRRAHPDGVDAVLDLVSYAPGAFDAALGSGGRVVSTNGAAGDGRGHTNVPAMPTTENLTASASCSEIRRSARRGSSDVRKGSADADWRLAS